MSSKTKNILSIIAYALLGLLFITIIFFSFIPKNFQPNLALPANDNNIGIMFETSNNSAEFSNVTNETYNEFKNTYASCFKETLLSSLFSGNFCFKANIQRAKSTYSPSYDGYKVTFSYNEDQTLKNGKANYHYQNNSEPVTFKRAYISVSSANTFEKVNIIIETKENESDVYYLIETYANFNNLYKFGNKIVKGE